MTRDEILEKIKKLLRLARCRNRRPRSRRRLGALVFAVVLNFLLCGWILFIFGVVQPDLRDPRLEPYFRTRQWEREGRFHLRLGVLRYQSMISKYMPGKPRPGRDVRTNRIFLQDMELATRNARARPRHLISRPSLAIAFGEAVDPELRLLPQRGPVGPQANWRGGSREA